jgi:hypothetical protein
MHGNAVFRQIQRQRLGQPDAAELRRAVAGVVLAADFAGFRVDLNDAPLMPSRIISRENSRAQRK